MLGNFESKLFNRVPPEIEFGSLFFCGFRLGWRWRYSRDCYSIIVRREFNFGIRKFGCLPGWYRNFFLYRVAPEIEFPGLASLLVSSIFNFVAPEIGAAVLRRNRRFFAF